MIHMPSLPMMVVIAAIGLLLFGKRLPEVGRGLGKGIVEFKKGLKGIGEEIELASDQPQSPSKLLPDHKFDPYTGKPVTPAPKFDPYTGKPLDETAPNASASADSHS